MLSVFKQKHPKNTVPGEGENNRWVACWKILQFDIVVTFRKQAHALPQLQMAVN